MSPPKPQKPNKVTVRIWMPTDMGIPGHLAKFAGVGHASLTLRVNDKKYYITWMAQGSPFQGCTINSFNNISTFTKAQDKQNMVNFFNTSEPTYKVKLKTRQPNASLLDKGLDADAIEAFWLDRLKNPPKYSFLSRDKNCTGCVAAALLAGGLANYVAAPTSWFVMDAGDLLKWIQKGAAHLGVDPQDGTDD